MSNKTVVSAKMGDRTVERLEEYAEKEGISRSQATERMCKQGLDVEESDMRLVPVKTDGGTVIEDELEFLSHQLKEQQQRQLVTAGGSVVVAVGMLFILAELTTGLPAWVTLTAGPPLIIGLLVYLWGVFHV